MGVHLERALILYEQSRFDLAEQEVRRDMETEPDNATGHALLGLCLSERGLHREAMWEAQEAVAREPDLPFAHYALASVLQDRERLDEAQQAILEAIRLDPKNTNYLAQLASIRCDQGRWQDAMEMAEQGLRLDAEHIACINLRALALNKLGRAAEARAAIESALVRDPLNAVTHANKGWACLQKGDTNVALDHFREALRLDAEFAMARHGIVECLKTRYLVYRLMLRFMLWMAGLSKRAQWSLILGGAAAYLGLLGLEQTHPELKRFIWPVLIVYLSFGVLVWIADPLFNLLLRLDRFGRLALTPAQLSATNWVGLCLAGAVVGAITAALTRWPSMWFAAGLCGILVVPVTGIFNCPAGRPRRAMIAYTLLVALLGASGIGFFAAARANWGVPGSVATDDQGTQTPLDADVRANQEVLRTVAIVLLSASVLGAFLSGGVALGLIVLRPRD
jgi:tetratricopeptide (TPR) repeat protein